MTQKNLWRCLSIICFCSMAGTALAQDNRKYVSVMGSYAIPDSERDADQGYGGRLLLGLPLSDRFALEIGGSGTDIKRESDDDKDDFYYSFGPDLVFAPRRGSFSDNIFSPFALIGLGLFHDDVKGERDNSLYANIGLGLMIPLSEQRVRLRLEGRYLMAFGDDAPSANDTTVDETNFNEILLAAGVQLSFGADAAPQQCVVCDSDQDGVQDTLDRCPGTPIGTPVNAQGCPMDTDGDGVTDLLDQCPNTPLGVPVDSTGCALDSDKDSVIDFVDQCPNTLEGLKVNAVGCVDTPQVLALRGVNFEFDKATLTLNSMTVLKNAAATLKAQPDLVVEIAGHTDSMGSDSYNLRLSERRAASVRDALVNLGVEAWRLQSRGYGETEPVTTNETEAGRAENRRVEFRVLSAE